MRTDANPRSGLDPLLSIGELAEYLGVPIKTIYEWRQTRRGPVGIRMVRHLEFAVSDVRNRIENQRESAPGRSAKKSCDLPGLDLVPRSEPSERSSSPTCRTAPFAHASVSATTTARCGGADLAAEMLGHTTSDITKQHYTEPDEKVNPVTAKILEALAPKAVGDDVGE